MGLRLRRHPDFPVTLIRLSGALDVALIRGELSRALATSDHVARSDRVVVVEEEIERDGVYISDLAELRQVVARLEGLRHAKTAYRSVIYPRYPVRPATVVEVYLALWKDHPEPCPHFSIVDSFEEAEALLGITGIAVHLP